MKVIITGGTGLIGRALTRQLARDEDEIVILSRGTSRPEGLPKSARIVTWDGQTGNGWSDELQNADAVVNLAGSNLSGSRWTRSRKQVIRESRVNAGNAVIDGLKKSGHIPSLVVQASGISYYGNRDDGHIDESEPPGDDFLARVCVEWETSTFAAEDMGARRIIIRSGPVLNTSEGALPPLVMPFHLFVGGRTGSGDQGISWIHLHDEVEAIRFLLRSTDISGPVNLCSPEPVSNRALVAEIGRVMNRPAIFPVPAFVLRGALGEVADTILLGQYAIPKRLQDSGFSFSFPTVEQALEDLIGNESGVPGSRLFRRGAAVAGRLLFP